MVAKMPLFLPAENALVKYAVQNTVKLVLPISLQE